MQSELINAVNGGQRKQFTLAQWNDLPADKYGWKIATEAPEEVEELLGQKPAISKEEELREKELQLAKREDVLKQQLESLNIAQTSFIDAVKEFEAKQTEFNKEVAAFEAKQAAISSTNGSTAKNGTNGNGKK